MMTYRDTRNVTLCVRVRDWNTRVVCVRTGVLC